MIIRVVAAAALMLSGCASVETHIAGSVSPSPTVATTSLQPPLADHHVHLLSPAGARRIAARPASFVELPHDMASLLRAREQAWNDPAALRDLYTADAVIHHDGADTWVQGAPAAPDEVAGVFARQYRVSPVAYGQSGATGWIAGYYSRTLESGAVRNFGHALLGLERDGAGPWRIAAETLIFPGPFSPEPSDAEQLVEQLDRAGVRRAAVLSTAFWWGSPHGPLDADEYEHVRAENDWTIAQAAQYPERLVAFCSVNPLKEYALAEVARCAARPEVRGIKLHFANSRIDLRDPTQLETVRIFFHAVNASGLAVAAHLWTGPSYGREEAEIFLEQILPEAQNVTVQIAHFAGAGPGYTDEALAVYAAAIQAGDPRTGNLYFDIATVAQEQQDPVLQALAARIRQVGVDRVLFASDWGVQNPAIRDAWFDFRNNVPLTDAEFDAISRNVAPYMR